MFTNSYICHSLTQAQMMSKVYPESSIYRSNMGTSCYVVNKDGNVPPGKENLAIQSESNNEED